MPPAPAIQTRDASNEVRGEPPAAAELKARLSAASVVLPHESLARRTTLNVGGAADLYVEPADERDLAELLRFCREHVLPLRVLGRGSNLLVRDGGVRGVVACLAQPCFTQVAAEGPLLRAGAGARLKQLAIEARRHALSGLEFLEGIPGSVGGALRMNAGAHGAGAFDVLERVRYLTPEGRIEERAAGEIPARYRSCDFFAGNLAVAAVFRGTPAGEPAIRERMDALNRRRWDTQPRQPSAGCIFKNPASLPAGRLLDELGLKGCRVGGAEISTVHANFMVNAGHATARDFLELIALVRARARAERGLELETEVEIIGED